ncbi:hypothetical protein ACROYT_G033106 [Oculina patagonica]
MKAVAVLFLFQVSFTLADFSPYRGKCSRLGNFDTRIEGSVLDGYVISKSQVPSRIDCTFECLNDQRCASYNYEEGNKALHECELNSESKKTKPTNLTDKEGYSYYGTGKNVPSGCASSPCINDGTCEDSCMEGTGFKCVCIEGRMGDKCQNWTSTAQDYEVVFPKESTTDYIESEMNEMLQQFTLCFWMNSTSYGWTTLFSYMTPDGKMDLKMRWPPQMERCYLQLIEHQRMIYMAPLVENMWHHICWSWENVEGRWDFIVNGAVVAHGTAWRQTLSVRPGKLIVGQKQEVYGGGFHSGDSFRGNVGSFNIWNTKMPNNEIIEMARSCSQELGNVIDWRMFRHGIHGDAEIRSPQSCASHVAESEFVLDFPARKITSYVDTPTLPTLNEFTFCFWMKRGFDGQLHGEIISYATTQEVRSLAIYTGDNGDFNLRIMDSSNVDINYHQPPIVDDLWHHVCITWTNVDGKTQLFLDGVLKYDVSGYKVDITIPSGGILRIGQRQRDFGGNHNLKYSYHGKLAKMNMWSTVLHGSAIVALLRSPGAENGDVISWKDIRTSLINGNVIVQDVANMQLTAQESDFDMIFASKSSANYAEYSSMPSLTAFTVCFWIKTSHGSDGLYFFSYATSSFDEAIALGYYPGTLKLTFNINAYDFQYYTVSTSLHDNGWHHICATWQSSNGKRCWYVDGSTLECVTGYKTGQTIAGNGKFILGQEQDSYGIVANVCT